MNKGISAAAGMLALGIGVWTTAHAVPITGDFSGTVWGMSMNNAAVPGDIGVGATVTGSFQFENTGQLPYNNNETVNERRYVSQSAGSFLDISVGGLVWKSEGLRLTVRDDSPLLFDDLLSLSYESSLGYADPLLELTRIAFPGIPDGLPNSSFGISLFDSVGPTDLLSGTGLPMSADEIDVSSINVMNGSIFGNVDGGTSFYSIKFTVDDVQFLDLPVVQEPGDPPESNDPVPVAEPNALSLMLLGLLFAVGGLRRRSRTVMAG
jgi:hypothetical protein